MNSRNQKHFDHSKPSVPTMARRQYPQLWSSEDCDPINDTKNESLESLSELFDRFSSTQTQSKQLLFFLKNSLVVGQQFAWTCLFLRYWVELLRQEHQIDPTIFDTEYTDDWRLQTSMILVTITLMIVVFSTEFSSKKFSKQPRKEKVRQRTVE